MLFDEQIRLKNSCSGTLNIYSSNLSSTVQIIHVLVLFATFIYVYFIVDYSREHIHESRFQRLPAAAVRSATATVSVYGTNRSVGGVADGAVADRLFTARLSAVRLGTVAVPERADRRAGHHTYLVDAAHAVHHRHPSTHRLQIRSRLTRARGPCANGFGQRHWAKPFVDRQRHQSGMGHMKCIYISVLLYADDIKQFLYDCNILS